MPLPIRKLGDVLLHIYKFPFEAAIYLPQVVRYDADTPCVIGGSADDEATFHQSCLQNGFKNWLNVAVVSDTCDAVSEKTEPWLIAAFNEDCRDGGWLRKMMNYRKSDSSCQPPS
jgi:hypothetical protein